MPKPFKKRCQFRENGKRCRVKCRDKYCTVHGNIVQKRKALKRYEKVKNPERTEERPTPWERRYGMKLPYYLRPDNVLPKS